VKKQPVSRRESERLRETYNKAKVPSSEVPEIFHSFAPSHMQSFGHSRQRLNINKISMREFSLPLTIHEDVGY
jgi:hypothetical protein